LADIFNRLIASRFAELARRMMGEDLELSTVAPEIALEMTLESDRPEWSFLKGEQLWQTIPVQVAAVAAQNGFVQLFNASKDRICIVTGCSFRKVTGGTITLALTSTIRGASFSGAQPRDTRWNSPIVPTLALTARDQLSCSQGTSIGFGTDSQISQDDVVTANVSQAYRNFPILVLAPGTGCLVSSSTVNEVFAAWFFGYSRQAKPEEL